MGADSARTIPALLRANAKNSSRLLFDDVTLSYAELADAADRLATGLAGLGIASGDRVAIWIANHSQWLVTFCACAKLGAIVVTLNPKFRVKEVGDIVSRSGARAIVIDSAAKDAISILTDCETLGDLKYVVDIAADPAVIPGRPELKSVAYNPLAQSAPIMDDYSSPEAHCLIFTTSGTTNKPKFVIHDQSHLIQHGHNLAAKIGVEQASVIALLVPFCGTYGMSATFCALSSGGSLVVPASWETNRVAELLQIQKVTHSMVTDDGAEHLLAIADAAAFASVKCMGIAGMNPRLEGIFDQAEAKGLNLIGMYGSSELQAIVSIQDPSAARDVRIGRGGDLIGNRGIVRVADPESGKVLPHGEAGELQFKVPDSFMREYFLSPEATTKAMTEDGFFRTGDLGYTKDETSFIYLARMGDSMRLGGFLVDPTEIETLLQSHPAVVEAQVVSIETENGTRPVAFIIPSAPSTVNQADLLGFVGKRLAKYKVPIHYHIVTEFPKTVSANGAKVQKAKLREMAERLASDAAA